MKVMYTKCDDCVHKIVCKMVNTPRYMATRDFLISIFRYEDDKEYNIQVSKGYYESYIPFENKDYK